MVFLILSILSSTAIFITFKLIGRYKINTFSTIIINYIVACLAGFFLSNSFPSPTQIVTSQWFPVSLLIGVMFIIMFWIIGLSTQKAGVAVTTVAGKLSVIIPIAFSIWYEANDKLTPVKLVGIALALVAVVLTSYRQKHSDGEQKKFLLPLILFIGMGIVDSFVKYAQAAYVSDEVNPIFSATVFGIAGITGFLALPFNKDATKDLMKLKTWVLGIVLGLVNFGSIYFIIGALNHIDINTGQQAEGSIIFGINNLSIVVLSVILGFVLFRERPSKVNWAGIALSVMAILILTTL